MERFEAGWISDRSPVDECKFIVRHGGGYSPVSPGEKPVQLAGLTFDELVAARKESVGDKPDPRSAAIARAHGHWRARVTSAEAENMGRLLGVCRALRRLHASIRADSDPEAVRLLAPLAGLCRALGAEEGVALSGTDRDLQKCVRRYDLLPAKWRDPDGWIQEQRDRRAKTELAGWAR